MGCRLLLFQYKTRLFPLSFPSNSSPPSLSLSLHNPSLLRHLPPPSPPPNSKLRYCFMCFSFCFLFVSWVSIFWIFLFVWTVIPENRNSRVWIHYVKGGVFMVQLPYVYTFMYGYKSVLSDSPYLAYLLTE